MDKSKYNVLSVVCVTCVGGVLFFCFVFVLLFFGGGNVLKIFG